MKGNRPKRRREERENDCTSSGGEPGRAGQEGRSNEEKGKSAIVARERTAFFPWKRGACGAGWACALSLKGRRAGSGGSLGWVPVAWEEKYTRTEGRRHGRDLCWWGPGRAGGAARKEANLGGKPARAGWRRVIGGRLSLKLGRSC